MVICDCGGDRSLSRRRGVWGGGGRGRETQERDKRPGRVALMTYEGNSRLERAGSKIIGQVLNKGGSVLVEWSNRC